NFYRAGETAEDVTKAVSQVFLGIRLECAQCHHHPFEKWGQDDFYGLVGFFNGVQRGKLSGDEELVHHPGRLGEMKIPGTGRVVPTRPPGGAALAIGEAGDPRQRLAEWVTRPENPWFAR